MSSSQTIGCSVPGCRYVTPTHVSSTTKQIKLLEIHTSANHPVQSVPAGPGEMRQDKMKELEALETVHRVNLHRMVQTKGEDIRSFVARLSGAAELCGRVGNIPYGDVVMKIIVLNGMFNKVIKDRAIRKISDGDLMTLTLLVDFISKEEKNFMDDRMEVANGVSSTRERRKGKEEDKASIIHISSVRSVHSNSDDESSNTKPKYKKKVCPYCHHLISAGNLRRHINVKHPDEEMRERKVYLEDRTSQQGQAVCGDCGLEEGDGSMIQCGDCQELYHLDCVDLSESELPFRCQYCKAHNWTSGVSKSREDPEAREGLFDCSICENKSFGQRSALYRHYSECHFHEKLKRFIDQDNLSCKICGIELKRLPYLICHVGATHDRVEEFLDKSHLVPRKLAWSHFQEGSGFNCNFCEKERKFSSKQKLYCHLSRCHFKEDIQPYIDEDKIQCLLCGLKMTRLNTLMSHVGVSHGKIEEFLQVFISKERKTDLRPRSPEDQDGKERSSGSGPTEDPRHSVANSVRSELGEDQGEENLSLSPTPKDLICHLCPMENHFLSRKRLYKHYAQSHFKDNIMELVGDNKLQCPVCLHEAFTVSDLVVHLGSVHDKVDLFLGEEFRVPRPRKRNVLNMDHEGQPVRKKPKFLKSEHVGGKITRIRIMKTEDSSLKEVKCPPDEDLRSSLATDLFLSSENGSDGSLQ